MEDVRVEVVLEDFGGKGFEQKKGTIGKNYQ